MECVSTKGSEMPQRQSPRGQLQLRTSSSDSDPLHRRPVTDKSPKLGDRRSPRGGAQPDSRNQKKLGTRIADLETQLGQAQEELKILKEQLASVQTAKNEAQEELEKKPDKPLVPEQVKIEERRSATTKNQESNKKNDRSTHEFVEESQHETDVFEVPVEKVKMEANAELSEPTDQEVLSTEPVSISTESTAISQPEKPSFEKLAMKNDQINSLKAKLEEKEKELEAYCQQKESLKSQLSEATLWMSSTRAKEGEMTSRLDQLGQELEKSKANSVELIEKLEAVEGAKKVLEAEMKKLRIQTEQWMKAADAAAAVLAGDAEINGRKISERCGSMDKQLGVAFVTPASGYAGFVSSLALADDSDDGFGSGKRKGSGIRMFGDLWKKKGQK